MLLDARTVDNQGVIETDVCIIGAGAAGISLAQELIDQPFRVCVVESGSLRHDSLAQQLLEGESVGHPTWPLDESRVAGFGGTTAIWAGACRPLDRSDFERRDWVPHSGWPFDRDQLNPYYARAHRVCQLGSYSYALEAWESPTRPRLPLPEDLVCSAIYHLSPPTRFGKVFRNEITRARNVCVLLHAPALEIETTENACTATVLRVATAHDKRLAIAATIFVLAAGGLENAHLLLLSRKARPHGLGNDHDLVGRFFMDHLYLNAGELRLREPGKFGLYSRHLDCRDGRAHNIEAVLTISDAALACEGLLKCAFLFPPRWRISDEFYSQGVTSLRHLVRLVRLGRVPLHLMRHLTHVVRELDKVAIVTAEKYLHRGATDGNFKARSYGEQTPNPNSRVTLSNRRDVLGRPQISLDWRLSELDLRSIRRAHEILAQAARQSGVGHFDVTLDEDNEAWPAKLTSGYHHIGTTRMHVDPHFGVVDADGLIHGMNNLFVTGTSVFPTSGYQNPTLTVVALATRLADHVKARLLG